MKLFPKNWLSILLLKRRIAKAESKIPHLDSIIAGAYKNMIKSYETSIMFLEAERKGK